MIKCVQRATVVPMNETIKMGRITTDGRVEPARERTAMMVEGTKEIPPKIKAKYTAISSETSPGDGLTFSNSCIALMPSGVAAWLKPSRLAAKLRVIAPMAGLSCGSRGKSRRRKGWRARASP